MHLYTRHIYVAIRFFANQFLFAFFYGSPVVSPEVLATLVENYVYIVKNSCGISFIIQIITAKNHDFFY